MRNIYVIISVLLFSLAACQEKEILGYSIERDGLQFDYDTNKMRVTVDFMQEYRTDTTWYSGIPVKVVITRRDGIPVFIC